MKKLIVLLTLLIVQPAYAEFDATVGPEISYISYREPGIPFGKDVITVKEDGVMYGIRGIAEYTDGVYLALDGKYSFGQVDYSGSGTIDNIEDDMIEARALIGYAWEKVTLYTGYGYRYLKDDMNNKTTSTGYFGYERESNYHYLPVGVKVITPLVPIQFEVDALLSGMQVSHLEKAETWLPEVKNKQTTGAGIKISVDLSRKIKNIDVHFQPFLRWWKVQSSEVFYSEVGNFREPKNTSLELGGQLSIKF